MPILATIGAGLAWTALTLGQLVMWGFGISLGFWVAGKVTQTWDKTWYKNLADKIHKRRFPEEAAAAVAATSH